MYSENIEIQNRISHIANRINMLDGIHEWSLLSNLFEKEIHKERSFYSYQNSLNLAFLLLNDKSEFSKIFWHSFALTYTETNNSFIKNLNISDVVNIIDSLEKYSKKDKEITNTLKKFENYIVQNGLLKKFSKNHIEFHPILRANPNYGASAILEPNHESFKDLIEHGKTLLTKIIFSIYGLKTTSGSGLETYTKSFVSEPEVEKLTKRGLVSPSNTRLKANLDKIMSKDFNHTYREYVYVYLHSKELVNQIMYESHIEDDFEIKIGFHTIFEELSDYMYFEAHHEFEFPPDADKKLLGNYAIGYAIRNLIAHAIEKLRELVNSRYSIFNSELASIDDIALVAGLSNPNSVINAVNGGQIKQGRSRFNLDKDSVIRWINDEKRKYELFMPIDSEIPNEDINYTYLLNLIKKEREGIKKLKKEKTVFNDDDKFVRTDKKIFGRVADHNKRRWEWIGEGKTFKEINAKNSTYRKCIDRKTYRKHTSPITQDILYDINSGYIKQIK